MTYSYYEYVRYFKNIGISLCFVSIGILLCFAGIGISLCFVNGLVYKHKDFPMFCRHRDFSIFCQHRDSSMFYSLSGGHIIYPTVWPGKHYKIFCLIISLSFLFHFFFKSFDYILPMLPKHRDFPMFLPAKHY